MAERTAAAGIVERAGIFLKKLNFIDVFYRHKRLWVVKIIHFFLFCEKFLCLQGRLPCAVIVAAPDLPHAACGGVEHHYAEAAMFFQIGQFGVMAFAFVDVCVQGGDLRQIVKKSLRFRVQLRGKMALAVASS